MHYSILIQLSHSHILRFNSGITMPPNLPSVVTHFFNRLKKREIEGSHTTGKRTAEVLRSFIAQQPFPHKDQNQALALIEAIRDVGELLMSANPIELAVGNIVRRVLHIIREADLSLAADDISGLGISVGSEGDVERDDNYLLSAANAAAASRNILRPPSMQSLLENMPDSSDIPDGSSSGAGSQGKAANKGSRGRKLKNDVIKAVNDLIQDIATCHGKIAAQAIEYIHQDEKILTMGSSETVLAFLCAAKEKKRSFEVYVAEGAPRYLGHKLAKDLAERGIQTRLIIDSAVFAMMSKVNMVIVGAHAIMANAVGLHMTALAAQKHAVPFVVLAGSHKLCPLYPNNPEIWLNELRSPSELLDLEEFSDCINSASGAGSLHVVNPAFDFVPPKHVSLFITDTGGHSPTFMYSLLRDYYSPDDLVVQR